MSATGGSLLTVRSLDDLVENSTTLMSDTIANSGDFQTVVISNESGDCWTWGSDSSYYKDLDCEKL